MLLGARQFFERRGAPTPPLPYDAEVEYLESTGTQFIETGITPASNMIIEGRFQASSLYLNNDPVLFLFTAGRSRLVGCRASSNLSVYAYLDSGSSSAKFPDLSVHTVRFDLTGTQTLYIDGANVYERGREFSSVPSGRTIKLFVADSNTISSYGHGSVMSFSVKDATTGQMMIDLVSVRKNGVGYMYDRVSGALFHNAGTGAFTIGPDKS